jgi:hypothetical protein
MRGLKPIFDFYLDASIHVALSVISLMGITFYLLGMSWDGTLMGFTFFSVIVCYNFIKYGVEAYKYLIVSNAYHRGIQAFSFVSFGFAMYFLFQLDRIIWETALILGLISALYAVPLLPNMKNLRSLGGFKIFIVALVWVGFTVLLPVMDAKVSLDWDIWVLFLQRFILVVVLILPFEIRDLKWDHKDLRTLPQVLGVKKTQRLGVILAITFFLLTFLKDAVDLKEIGLRLTMTCVLIFVLASQRRIMKRYFVSFWIEGIPVMWLALFWIMGRFV